MNNRKLGLELGCAESRANGNACRDVVHRSSPRFTQSTILLREAADGMRHPVHTRLPATPAVFQVLAATVPTLLELRRAAGCSTSDIKVAVIGAGACAVPAALAEVHSEVAVDAVDIDAGTLA